MTRFLHRHVDGDHRVLAPTFFRNAEGFLQGAESTASAYPQAAGYSLAISLELALKGHLLDRGISDDWNRTYLRHDLVKALRAARRIGVGGLPSELAPVAALLTPFYAQHEFCRFPTTLLLDGDWRHIVGAVRSIIRVG